MQTAAYVAMFVLAVLVFSWVARRLIGATRVGPVQVLISGLVGCGLAAAVAVLLQRFGPEDDSSVLATAVVVAVLATMATIVGLQLLRRPRPRDARRIGLVGSVRTTRRTIEVLRVGAKHGLRMGRGEADSAPSGASLRAALEESGVVFVKLGQALADRPDIVPPRIAADLAQLQSQVAPLPRTAMEPELRAQIGDTETVFSEFDWVPLGSASIGQAYQAQLRDGTRVIVKIRRPGVVREVERDSATALNVAEILERRISWARQVGLTEVVRGLLGELAKELDYANESRAMLEMSESPAESLVDIPRPFPELCSSSVVVMEQVEGVPLSRLPREEEPRRGAAVALASAVLGPMFRGERFHADPHPGNVLLGDGGRVALVDFGSTAVLPPHEQSSLRSLFLGVKLREPALMRDALLGVAQPTRPLRHAELDGALAQLLADHMPPGGGLDPAAVPELLDLSADAGLRMPASSGVLFRALLTLLASLQRLDPDYDVLESADQIAGIDEMVLPSSTGLTDFVQQEVLKAAPIVRRAPRLLDSVVTKVDRGDLSVHVRVLSHQDDVDVVNGIVNRALLVALAGILGIVSAMLFGLTQGPYLGPTFSVYDLLGAIGLVTGAVLAMRVLLEVLDTTPRR